MSKYVLNEETALVLDGEVYVLARERELTRNTVCDKCALYDICVDIEDNHKLSELCTPDDSDQRWFFLRNLIFRDKGGKDFVRLINKVFVPD